ncbi:thioesterase family protein [Desulfonatronospira sp.]|uniref:acyl-CoA thioesterase n=1 Tax=Desulfonatronospira sp. TaxID=1962951 RepID=UPI0025C6A8AF|nr:thioesterase family protein [Desulfonatronospira sp.]
MKPAVDFPAPETRHPHRVSYGETDAMGVVYYANYLHWFEMARSTYIRERGIGYAEIEARGVFLPVTEAWCKYMQPCRFDELIFIRAAVSRWGKASFTFCYEVLSREQDRVLTLGRTEHVCMGPEGRPVRVPAWLKEMCLRR